MMNSPMAKMISLASWLLTAIAAIGVGLMPMGYDFFNSPNLGTWARSWQYLLGAAGVYSLITLIMIVMHKGCHGCKDSCCPGGSKQCMCSRCGMQCSEYGVCPKCGDSCK